MVLAELLRQKYLEPLRGKNRERREQMRRENFKEGQEKVNREWREWNSRRREAEAAGVPFNEPTPGQEKSTNN